MFKHCVMWDYDSGNNQKVSPYRKMSSPFAVRSLGSFLNSAAQPSLYIKLVQTAKRPASYINSYQTQVIMNDRINEVVSEVDNYYTKSKARDITSKNNFYFFRTKFKSINPISTQHFPKCPSSLNYREVVGGGFKWGYCLIFAICANFGPRSWRYFNVELPRFLKFNYLIHNLSSPNRDDNVKVFGSFSTR